MRIIIGILMLVILFGPSAMAGTQKDRDFMDKASELTYEGQLKMAEKLAGQATPASESKDDSSGTSLFLTMIWGALGTGYFIYGKKQSRFTFLICGVGLMVFPFFISDLTATIVLGLVMTLAPFKIDF